MDTAEQLLGPRSRNADVPTVIAAALRVGCCSACALRYAGFADACTWMMGGGDGPSRLARAVRHVGARGTTAALPEAEPAVCVACRGLLAGRARAWHVAPSTLCGSCSVLMNEGKGEGGGGGENRGDASGMRAGPATSAAIVSAGEVQGEALLMVTDEWTRGVLQQVVVGGYDCRDGIAVNVQCGKGVLAAEARARTALLAERSSLLERPTPASRLPGEPIELKDALRGMLAAELGRLVFPTAAQAGGEQGALLLSVAQGASALEAAYGPDSRVTVGTSSAPPPAKRARGVADGEEEHPFWCDAPLDMGLQRGCDARDIVSAAAEAVRVHHYFSTATPPLPPSLPVPRMSGAGVGEESFSPSSAFVHMGTGGTGGLPSVPFVLGLGGLRTAGEGAGAHVSGAGAARLGVHVHASLQLMLVVDAPGEAEDGEGGGAGAALPSTTQSWQWRPGKTGKGGKPGKGHVMAPPAPARAPAPSAGRVGGSSPLATVTTTLTRSSLYLRGRYVKLARGMSQTPWYVNGTRRNTAETASVEETLGGPLAALVGASATPVGRPCALAPAVWRGETECVPALSPSDILALASSAGGACALPWAPAPAAVSHAPRFKFHSAGREDVDVRMLGGGRPFVIELLDARPAVLPLSLFPALQIAVNGSAEGRLEARRMAPASREEFGSLAVGAEGKRKRYVAVCWSSRPLTQGELSGRLHGVTYLPLAQQTPVRVLHRRSLMTRAKTVHGLRARLLLLPEGAAGGVGADWEGAHPGAAGGGGGAGAGGEARSPFFLLSLECSAGTYVKEFVHGDCGRTAPSLASLLAVHAADILALDVVDLRDGRDPPTFLEDIQPAP